MLHRIFMPKNGKLIYLGSSVKPVASTDVVEEKEIQEPLKTEFVISCGANKMYFSKKASNNPWEQSYNVRQVLEY